MLPKSREVLLAQLCVVIARYCAVCPRVLTVEQFLPRNRLKNRCRCISARLRRMSTSKSSSSSQSRRSKQTTLFQTWGYDGNESVPSDHGSRVNWLVWFKFVKGLAFHQMLCQTNLNSRSIFLLICRRQFFVSPVSSVFNWFLSGRQKSCTQAPF